MRKSIIALLAIALLAIPATMAGDEVTGETAMGAQRSHISDSANRAAEYQSERDGFALSTWWDMNLEGGEQIQLDFSMLNSNEQEGYLRYNNGKSWTIEATLRRFDHNLPHDPLSNLEATDEGGKATFYTDEDPNAHYGIRVNESVATLKYRPHDAQAWELAIVGKRLRRSGTRQHTSVGHCENCHIVGQTRTVNETTDTVKFLASYEKPSHGVSYEASFRDFNSDADSLSRYYQYARHPGKPIASGDLFRNRVQFDDSILPVGVIPESKSLTQTFRGYYSKDNNHVDGAVAFAQNESQANGLRAKHSSARVRWLHTFDDTLALAIHGRYTSLSSDDYFIDVNDSLRATQGPQAGQSYYDIYLDAPGDFLRQSAFDRKTSSAQADLTYRYGAKKRQRIKGSLIAKQTDRDEFMETKEFKLRALFSGRMGDKSRYRFSAELLSATDPFANIRGGFREPRSAGHDPSGNPFSDLQYYDMYATRIADLTNQPTSGITAKAYFTTAKTANSALTFTGSYVDQKNDETNVYDWEKTAWNLGMSVWWAPSDRLFATASYTVMDNDVWTGVSVPVLDG